MADSSKTELFQQDHFDFNDLYVGCPILIKPDPTSKQEIFAMVSRVNPDSVDAMGIIGGRAARLQPYADCWHESDPRIQDRPRVFRSPLRGIFKLAPNEVSRINALRRVADLEQLIELLVDRIEQLEAKK